MPAAKWTGFNEWKLQDETLFLFWSSSDFHFIKILAWKYCTSALITLNQIHVVQALFLLGFLNTFKAFYRSPIKFFFIHNHWHI